MARNAIMGKFLCMRAGPDHWHSRQSEVDLCNEQFKKERDHQHRQEIAKQQHYHEIRRMQEEQKQGMIRTQQMQEANRMVENQQRQQLIQHQLKGNQRMR